MNCLVYRCAARADTYLYLRADLSTSDLPDALRQRLGTLAEVMQLDLQPTRKLARVDSATVLERLADPGWFLQLPPDPAAG